MEAVGNRVFRPWHWSNVRTVFYGGRENSIPKLSGIGDSLPPPIKDGRWHGERSKGVLLVDTQVAETKKVFAKLVGEIAARTRLVQIQSTGKRDILQEHLPAVREHHVVLNDWCGCLNHPGLAKLRDTSVLTHHLLVRLPDLPSHLRDLPTLALDIILDVRFQI